MLYAIKLAAPARRALKKLERSGRRYVNLILAIFDHLERGEALPARFKDHQLRGKLNKYRECHVAFNLLIQYERDEEAGIVTIANIGPHPKLFGE